MIGTKKRPSLTGLETAVIGMAGRFPAAANLNEFWENLKNGKESICFFSEQELTEAGVDPKIVDIPHYVRAKGILEEIEYFDSDFFNYTPKEAEMMDPQVRLFHQCAWQALEDAGYDPGTYPGVIGLYAGYTPNIFWRVGNLLRGGSFSEQFESGNLDSHFFSTLICYKLNLKGPGITLNTACSTALVAIHMACRALLTGEADMVMAGGVTITLPWKSGYIYQEGMINSPDGHCRAFAAAANGIVGGNGIGIVLLKRLVKALADNDHIYAVIKGTAVNNDGSRKPGYAAPSVAAQAEVIRSGLRMAELEPEQITYIETHGTGTPLGDPIEIEALKKVFDTPPKSSPQKKYTCTIGSVKTNIGHLDAAAGAAGFIKTVLALKHRLIPPTLHFETANPAIDFTNSPFVVNNRLVEWKHDDQPRCAAVSAFGIGGTNAHVILEEFPEETRELAPLSTRQYRLILLSAKTPTALDKMTENLAEYLKKSLLNRGNPGNPTNPGPTLADVAYTLQAGRKPMAYRRMLACSTSEEAVEGLLSPGPPKVRDYFAGEENKDKPVVFMFPGLGSQYVNLGLELYQAVPVFRQEMDRCFEILKPLMGYDIEKILYPHPDRRGGSPDPPIPVNSPDINQTEIAQPVVFIFEYALAKLLMKWGIAPQAMIGYSFGEYTAACISGVFSLEEALKLVVARGQLLRQTPPAAMSSVPLPEEKLKPLLDTNLSIAIDNGSSCVVSGSTDAVETFEKQMKDKKYLCIRLQASHGLHSLVMDSILQDFEAEVARVRLNKPQIPYISNVTGKWTAVEQVTTPRYWATHLRSTVQFAAGLQELTKMEKALLVEVGPGVALSTLAMQYIDKKSGQQALNLVRASNQEIPDLEYLLGKIGRLWLYGKSPDWQSFYGEKPGRRLSLPTYPFEKRVYSIELPGLKELFSSQPRLAMARAAAATGEIKETPVPPGPRQDTPYAAPGNNVERLLVEYWEELLGIKPIGIHDNFFELGGDSVKGITLVNRFKEVLGEIVHITVIFDAPTVAELAVYFKKHYPRGYTQMMGKETETAVETKTGETAAAVTVERIAQVRGMLPVWPIPGNIQPPKNPPAVFVLSPPRSGSTLFRVMLGGHPRLFAPPELNLLAYLTLQDRKNALTGAASSHLQGTLRSIMLIKDCTVQQAEYIMQQFEKQGMTVKQFYCQLQEWARQRNQLLVEKTPGDSIGIDVLKRMELYFQDPLYIHLVRHPYGMVRSYVEAKMDLLIGQQMIERLACSREELAELTWTISVQNILEFLKDIPQPRQLCVRFEDLLNDPETITRDICRFLNLEFHPAMLQPYQEKKQRMTDGVYSEGIMLGDMKFHQHKAINPAIADTWKEEYTIDFLGEPTWQIARTFGYKSIQELQEENRVKSDEIPKARRVDPVERVQRSSAQQLLNRLDQLSDDEVNTLLEQMLNKEK